MQPLRFETSKKLQGQMGLIVHALNPTNIISFSPEILVLVALTKVVLTDDVFLCQKHCFLRRCVLV